MSHNWIGLVPAAGKGVRLQLPYPKELYPVIRDGRYKPVSQFVVDNLVVAGVKHIVFVINETKSQLLGFFGSGNQFNCNISYVVQQPRIDHAGVSTSPGLADALDAAYHLIDGKMVFFGMADTIMQPKEIFTLGYQTMELDDDLVLCMFPTQRPEKFGMVRFQENKTVTEIIDKPTQTDLTYMWGCLIWKPVFTDFLHQSVKAGQDDFAVIMNLAIKAGLKFRAVPFANGNFIDLGTYEEIRELDRRLRED